MHELLLEALNTFPNFLVVDEKAVIVYINRGYARLLGTTTEEAVGAPVTEVIPNTRLHHVLRTGKDEMGAVMTLYDHVSGQDITVVCNRIPIRHNGKIIGAVAATAISSLLDLARLNEEIALMRRENQHYKAELDHLKDELNPLHQVVGQSSVITQLKASIADYADSNLTMLLTGETGVGKEVFARAIHQLSRRGTAAYVKLNCAAIPDNLLESELFGYAEGAFSGAAKGGKIGKFEQANGGTLLLDEIGEMPLVLQSKLLRVLQEKEIERVGGTKSTKIDVRILCATNQSLEQLVKEGRFREDLYYRINVVELHIPPLRERLGDIPLLGQFFIERMNTENGYAVTGIDPDALTLLQSYNWPGNVRELEHVIQRAAVLCRAGTITLQHMDFFSAKANRIEAEPVSSAWVSLRTRTEQTERDSIIEALTLCNGNKSKAAHMLGIDRSRLYDKLRKYQIM